MQCTRCASEDIEVTRTIRDTDHDTRECQCKICKQTFVTETRITGIYEYSREKQAAVLKPVKAWPDAKQCNGRA